MLVRAEIFEGVVARKRRLAVERPHISENQPVAFFDGIPGLPYLVLELTAIGLARLFEAVALGVEFPAVIAAADAVFLDLAVIERRAAMAAARVQQARTPPAIPEKNQIL